MKNIVVVTGASSGMGYEFAKLITETENIDEIWLIARRNEKLIALASELKVKAQILQIDLSKLEDIENIYKKKLENEKPNITVLALSQGVGRFSHFENISLDENINMIDVNFKATVVMAYLSIPYMKNGSNMMIIDSGSSIQPVPYENIYASTKAATLSFGRSLNRELKYKGIHVLSVIPLWVESEFFNHAINEKENKVVINYGKVDMPKDVMKKAIKDLYTKKDVSIYGAHNLFQNFMVKLLPHKLIMNIWLKQQTLDGTPLCRKNNNLKIKKNVVIKN